MKHKFKYILAISIIALPSYFYFKNDSIKETEPTVSYKKVEKWDIKNSIYVVWKTELVDEQTLNFNISWAITQVNFNDWDKVKKWDVIAEIDSSDAYASIENAKISLENAKINLNELYKEVDDSALLKAQNNIKDSQNALDIAKKEFDNLKVSQTNSLNETTLNIENSKKELESLEKNLTLLNTQLETLKKDQENSLWNTNVSIINTIKWIENNLKTSFSDIWKSLEEADIIIWITEKNRDKNNSYEDYLGIDNLSIKYSATTATQKSITDYEALKTAFNNYSETQNVEELIELLNTFSEYYTDLSNTFDLIYKTAQNSVSSNWFTESDISNIESTFYNYKSSALTSITNITNNLKTLNTLDNIDLIQEGNNNDITSKEDSITSQKLSIKKKKEEIENLEKSKSELINSQKIAIESKENDIDSKTKAIELAKIDLEELIEWPTDENVRKAENSIKQAEISLNNSYKKVEDYQLIAPFDGIIRQIDYKIWDKIVNDTQKYVYIENPNLVEIKVMLDQIDIVKVNSWDNATITFDTYSTKPVEAKINSINTTPVESSWVVSYEVKLVLNEEFNKKLYSWMTADVEIVTESSEDVFTVNSSDIKTVKWKEMINIRRDWKEEMVEVETWIVASWKTEIISWLIEGDEIVSKEFVINPSKQDSSSSWFNLWWWGRPRWGF